MAYDVSKLITLGQLKSLAMKVKSEDQALLGTSSDASTAITIYGARALADTKVASVTAGNNGVDIGGTSTAPTVGLKLSAKADNELSISSVAGEEGLYYKAAAAVVYSMAKDTTATAGMAATYHLTADGVNTGVAIDIPKDFLVKSATLETVTTADQPYAGAQPGDKYIDFVINAKDASETAEHIYLPVNDLVDVYTGSNAIDVSSANVISLIVDTTNANGLEVTNAGLKMNTVVASTSGAGGSNGAMTAAQAEKLAGITEGANKVEASNTNGNIKIDNVETTVYDVDLDTATDAEVAEMMAEVWPTT